MDVFPSYEAAHFHIPLHQTGVDLLWQSFIYFNARMLREKCCNICIYPVVFWTSFFCYTRKMFQFKASLGFLMFIPKTNVLSVSSVNISISGIIDLACRRIRVLRLSIYVLFFIKQCRCYVASIDFWIPAGWNMEKVETRLPAHVTQDRCMSHSQPEKYQASG